MAINYSLYKAKIIQASKDARNASTIDEALDIQAQGYADALEAAILQATVNTQVVTPDQINGTGIGTVS